MFAEIGFWICLALIAYIYVGYPVGVFLLAPFVNRHILKAHIVPSVTVVIAAHNEERVIEHTVLNMLSQDYPPDRLHVIVVSDGSTDRTDEILDAIAGRAAGRLTVLRQEPRQGKTQALNLAVPHASSDIVAFADANSMYAAGAVRSLVQNFADPSVGYVTGKMIYTNFAGSTVGDGCARYMRYENLLRAMETRLGSVVGVDGGIDAIRRELYLPMRSDQLPDFVLPLNVVEQGKRVVYEPEAVLYEPALSSAADEFQMRVRVALRAIWALYDKRGLLNPVRHPLFAWQLLSHKAFRYMAFVPLLALLVFNVLALSEHWFYLAFLVFQLLNYAMAALGHLIRSSSGKASRLLTPYYFLILNAACLMAFWKFMNHQKMATWKPRTGAEA